MAQATNIALDFAEELSTKFAPKNYEFSVIPGRVYDKIVQTYRGDSQGVHA